MAEKTYDLDDGAKEAVTRSPRRRAPTVASLVEAAAMPVGGRMARMRATAASKRQEFAMIRAPLGVAKIALQHLAIFDALWRLWAAKRVTGGNPGVTVHEIASGDHTTLSAVKSALATLIRNGIVRSTRTSIGWANVKAIYFPTELGIQILGIAQLLGPGTSIQVGRTPEAWRSRAADEPDNFFKHAAFLRGAA